MGSLTETTRNKTTFKKRAHRPWQPALLDNSTEEAHNVIPATSKLQEKQIEFLQKQLEATLEIKSKEKEAITHTLSTIDDHRITLGGFLRPKDILLVTDQNSLHNSVSLIHELKEKEQEIQSITQNLKITQAEEFAKRAEAARIAAEQARHAAEEKAIFALRQAQQAAGQIKVAEEHSQDLEQITLKLEHRVHELEDKLKLASQQLERLGQTTENDGIHRQKIEHEVETLASELQEAQHSASIFQSKMIALNQQIESEHQAKTEFENKFFEACEKISELEYLLNAEKERFSIFQQHEYAEKSMLQQSYLELKEVTDFLRADKATLTQENQHLDTQLSCALSRMAKMTAVITAERNLRIVCEEKMKQALLQVEQSELKHKIESQARRAAEEQAKTAYEHAGKAMLQLLQRPA